MQTHKTSMNLSSIDNRLHSDNDVGDVICSWQSGAPASTFVDTIIRTQVHQNWKEIWNLRFKTSQLFAAQCAILHPRYGPKIASVSLPFTSSKKPLFQETNHKIPIIIYLLDYFYYIFKILKNFRSNFLRSRR